MSFPKINSPIFLDFHTHRQRRQDHDDIMEIVSIHLGQEGREHDYYTIGKHPWWTEEVLSNEETATFKKHYQKEKCLALGEMGLDKLKGPSLEKQMDVLRSQLQVANQLGASVIIHCVRAYDPLLKVKKEFPEIANWCIHGYSRNEVLAKQLIKEGFYISLMPQFNNDDKLAKLLKVIPLNRLFLETDSMPDVTIESIYLQASRLLGIPLKELQEQLINNANEFFNHE